MTVAGADITMPIRTPTSATHAEAAAAAGSPTDERPYSAAQEDFATSALLSEQSTASELASQQVPVDLEVAKAEAQALIDAQKFGTRKAFKAHLDEEIGRLTREAEARAKKRDEALKVNEGVDEEIKKLEAQYETERRALGRRLQELGK
ncbi:uncharacterized protein PV09_02846 [Verruconis gallopava]|uniref:Uncharacterized protein n=1 Tax=Verruconis gallopava TaxID=253628 RepID=A0A0D2AHK4_9PEZI|nr:uncharacterized protein PV09_02846 [Verruconis gallopava]KIW06393.1 hypothetical protein PV09_02846 [Verruconis gallopava]